MSCDSEAKILGNEQPNTKEELKEEDESYQLSYNFIKGAPSKITTDFKLQIEKKDFNSTAILQRSQRRRIFQNHHVGHKGETEKLKSEKA